MIGILEDDEGRIAEMLRLLESENSVATRRGLKIEVFRTASSMIEWLKEQASKVKLLSLDHDLEPWHYNYQGIKLGDSVINPGSGREVTTYLATTYLETQSRQTELLEGIW